MGLQGVSHSTQPDSDYFLKEALTVFADSLERWKGEEELEVKNDSKDFVPEQIRLSQL
jgi:hypothetical protein